MKLTHEYGDKTVVNSILDTIKEDKDFISVDVVKAYDLYYFLRNYLQKGILLTIIIYVIVKKSRNGYIIFAPNCALEWTKSGDVIRLNLFFGKCGP